MTDAPPLFEATAPGRYTPTTSAIGPWDRTIVHGAAVAALFAGRLQPDDDATVGRLTVEFLAPVPMDALELELVDVGGGSRVRRRRAVLTCHGRQVAAASAVIVRRGEVELPPEALDPGTPFSPDSAPPLDGPDEAIAEQVGWTSFDSQGVVVQWMRNREDPRLHLWVRLLVPVVDGDAPSGAEVVAVAADYAQSAVSRVLPFRAWSFRNAELTVHFSRPPVGTWAGVRSEALLQPVGAGFSSGDLFDEAGRVARSAASLVIEERRAPTSGDLAGSDRGPARASPGTSAGRSGSPGSGR